MVGSRRGSALADPTAGTVKVKNYTKKLLLLLKLTHYANRYRGLKALGKTHNALLQLSLSDLHIGMQASLKLGKALQLNHTLRILRFSQCRFSETERGSGSYLAQSPQPYPPSAMSLVYKTPLKSLNYPIAS